MDFRQRSLCKARRTVESRCFDRCRVELVGAKPGSGDLFPARLHFLGGEDAIQDVFGSRGDGAIPITKALREVDQERRDVVSKVQDVINVASTSHVGSLPISSSGGRFYQNPSREPRSGSIPPP